MWLKLLSFLSFGSLLFDNEALTHRNMPNLKLLPCCVEAIRSTNTALSHPGDQTQNTQTDIQTDWQTTITRGAAARLGVKSTVHLPSQLVPFPCSFESHLHITMIVLQCLNGSHIIECMHSTSMMVYQSLILISLQGTVSTCSIISSQTCIYGRWPFPNC